MVKSTRGLALLPMSCLVVSLALVAGTPSLSGCRSTTSSGDDQPQEVVVKDEDAPADDQLAAEQGIWVLSKAVTTYTFEDTVSQVTGIYEYDERGNLTRLEESDGEGYSSTESYLLDEDGHVTAISVAYGEDAQPATVEYTSQTDDAGRVVHSEAADGSAIDDYTYDEDGNRIKAVYTRTYTTYDEETGAQDETLQVVTYTYDTDGYETSYRNEGMGYANVSETTYEHDDAGRVTKATTRSWAEDEDGNEYEGSSSVTTKTYEYDDNGNVVRQTVESDSSTWTCEYEWAKVESPSQAAQIEAHLKV